MITNTEELQYVREQLVHVESALAALRRDILPVSQEWYDLMAEGYIDQILRLRAEIDEYLGIDEALAGATAVQEQTGDGQ